MVYQQQEEDAFSDLYSARRLAFSIFLLGGLGIVATALLLSRRMVSLIAQADREKEMMNEQVIEAAKLASVGELAAGIALEINNPVAIMVEEAGWIEDLLDEKEFETTPNVDEFRRAMRQIRTQGKRCKEPLLATMSQRRDRRSGGSGDFVDAGPSNWVSRTPIRSNCPASFGGAGWGKLGETGCK